MPGTESPPVSQAARYDCQAGESLVVLSPSETTLNYLGSLESLGALDSGVLNGESSGGLRATGTVAPHSNSSVLSSTAGLPGHCVLPLCAGSGCVYSSCGQGAGALKPPLSAVDVLIDNRSLICDPFTGGSREAQCRAVHELLCYLLTITFDYDFTDLLYHRLRDERLMGTGVVEPVEIRILSEIAARHGVVRREEGQALPSFRAMRVWLAYFGQQLLLGVDLRLVCLNHRACVSPLACRACTLARALLTEADSRAPTVCLPPCSHTSISCN
jgi:hypothetical protein